MGRRTVLVSLSLLFCWGGVVVAADEASVETEPLTLEEAVMGGKVDFNLRLRAEFVEQDGFDSSQAYTGRLRLGYGSKPYQGLSFYVDMEDIRTAVSHLGRGPENSNAVPVHQTRRLLCR